MSFNICPGITVFENHICISSWYQLTLMNIFLPSITFKIDFRLEAYWMTILKHSGLISSRIILQTMIIHKLWSLTRNNEESVVLLTLLPFVTSYKVEGCKPLFFSFQLPGNSFTYSHSHYVLIHFLFNWLKWIEGAEMYRMSLEIFPV